jgi:hypothetical protein
VLDRGQITVLEHHRGEVLVQLLGGHAGITHSRAPTRDERTQLVLAHAEELSNRHAADTFEDLAHLSRGHTGNASTPLTDESVERCGVRHDVPYAEFRRLNRPDRSGHYYVLHYFKL